MWRFILRRFLLMVPTFVGVTLVTFLLLRAAPLDPAAANVQLGVTSQQLSMDAIKANREHLGIDRPFHEQYLNHLRRLVTLDLGTRWKDKRPIREIIAEALPQTLMLALTSLFLSYLIAIPVGAYSAVREHSWTDQLITLILFVLYSMPVYWVAIMLIVFLASGEYTGGVALFPATGLHSFAGFEKMTFLQALSDRAYHAVLPIFALTYGGIASISRYQRSALLETIRQDYIRTARAKGLSERVVLFNHALRNSLIPIITLLGLSLPSLVSGAVITEMVFQIRGMGLVALEAVSYPDYPLVMTLVSITALLTMLGVLLSDILYAVVDPRISMGDTSRD